MALSAITHVTSKTKIYDRHSDVDRQGAKLINHRCTLACGMSRTTKTGTSAADLKVSENEATRRGHRNLLSCHDDGFVELASTSLQADFVALDPASQ